MPYGACRTSIDTGEGSRRLTSQIASVAILWASTLAPATFPLISTARYPKVWTVVISDSTQCSGSPVLFDDGSRQWIDHIWWIHWRCSTPPSSPSDGRLWRSDYMDTLDPFSFCCEKLLTTTGFSSPCFAHRPFSDKNGQSAGNHDD